MKVFAVRSRKCAAKCWGAAVLVVLCLLVLLYAVLLSYARIHRFHTSYRLQLVGQRSQPAWAIGLTSWAAEANISHSNQRTIDETKSGIRRRSSRQLSWNRKVYLPLGSAAVKGFRTYNERLRKRLAKSPFLSGVWGTETEFFRMRSVPGADADGAALNTTNGFRQWCLDEVPECEFFLHCNASIAFVKCCNEHYKMKSVLFQVLDALNEVPELEVFLDSGTLLSFARDGGETLLPWETDIDLGVIGAEPRRVDRLFAAIRNRSQLHLEQCLVDGATRRCKDAHYVYFVHNKSASLVDSCRVEIWPFDVQGSTLVHPTRPWLNVDVALVRPLTNCSMWGRSCRCPSQVTSYLDFEYQGRDGWAKPRTIHWGERNVEPWR